MNNTWAARAEPASRAAQIAAFQRQRDACAHHDLDAMVSVYTEGVHYEEKTLRWDLHSRDEVRDQFGVFFAATSELGLILLDSVHEADRAAFLWRFTGTLHSGPRFDVFGASQSTFTPDGRISHEIAVWNLAELPDRAAQDLGLNPATAYTPFTAWAANGRGTAAARLAKRF
ncbi:nuclear transport factor 2 family protein [Streptomyces coeruleoprunus]|uniref:Nuclear transport factor 2 family protein n=1 Tax=Streptomyces coeruleoprunus TaxID=285563 RepID=A0ABV9X9B2_9ACTN